MQEGGQEIAEAQALLKEGYNGIVLMEAASQGKVLLSAASLGFRVGVKFTVGVKFCFLLHITHISSTCREPWIVSWPLFMCSTDEGYAPKP